MFIVTDYAALSNVHKKHRTITDSYNGSNKRQQVSNKQNHGFKTYSSLSHPGSTHSSFPLLLVRGDDIIV